MTNWQRLEQVILWTGLSTNAFAKSIGLKRSENLYQIKRGSFGISKELARLIVEKYSNISRSWLLTGDGRMFVDMANDKAESVDESSIPFYDIDAAMYVANKENIKPLYKISMPGLKNIDFAATSSGTAMVPVIPSGSTIFLRKVHVDAMLPGEMYLVVTNEYAIVRYLRSVPGNRERVMLVAANNAEYDSFEMDIDKIEQLYLVKGLLVVK